MRVKVRICYNSTMHKKGLPVLPVLRVLHGKIVGGQDEINEMKTDFKELDDRALVDRLLCNDQSAWEYVLMTVALRVANRRKFKEMLLRTGHEPMEAVTELCERLYKDDFALLRTFAFRGSFDGWIGMVVRSVVQKITGLTGKESQGREVPMDPQDPTSPIALSELAVSAVDVHVAVMDKRESFTRFWQENQESAFILLMKNELELPLDVIGALLNRPANTISQKARRAEVRLDELEAE